MDGVTCDYMKIQYAGTDKLYLLRPARHGVEIHRHRRRRQSCKLSRMGGTDWQRRNQRKAQEMAKQLIKLYAERMKLLGFAFYPTTICSSSLKAHLNMKKRKCSKIAGNQGGYGERISYGSPALRTRLFRQDRSRAESSFKAVSSGKRQYCSFRPPSSRCSITRRYSAGCADIP